MRSFPAAIFSRPTREWFLGAFAEPTAAQVGAWRAIAAGQHSLVIAPTGSGKTLAAFLWAIDQLTAGWAIDQLTAGWAIDQLTTGQEIDQPTDGKTPATGTAVLYISPLKALAVDVERNLQAPLVGIAHTAQKLGERPPQISVGVRSGDTPPAERRRLRRTPPDILITTPESLFLLLTSDARQTLRSVHTVIVDEVHAIAGSKRGAHLALSLARLDRLTARPAQRIGLSATVRPPERIGQFLVGAAPITIVAPPAPKTFEISVQVPVPDMTETNDEHQPGSLWPFVDEAIVETILQARSAIVFTNSRRGAERLTARLNESYATRLGYDIDENHAPPAQLGSPSESNRGAPPLLARAHHGSVSREQRGVIEDDLKTGRLRCVVATSSLELGIDMGAVDLVVQVAAPPSVASGLQRIGRAGHQVGEISRGVLFPKHRTDVVQCAVAAWRMTSGRIEELRIPAHPLDILAQHTIAACALDTLDVEEWFATVRQTGSYSQLPRPAFEAVLDMLAGRYPSDVFAELRPRVIWDRQAGTLTGRPGAQRLAVTSGGAIPDRGMFAVYVVGEKGSRVGELDEEMVYESRVGDVFALGATSWRIEEITFDRVLVSPAFGLPGRLPFWHGDGLGRPAELGRAVGEFLRTAGKALASESPTALAEVVADAGLDANALSNMTSLLAEQRAATGQIPTDRTLVVERFRDELGDWRLVLHSPYGLPVHAPWALAVRTRLRERFGIDAAPTASDDGIVIRLPDTTDQPPDAELFVFAPEDIEELVTEQVGGSALFAARFRECAARALLLPRRDPGKRAPLWQQRQRAAQLLDVARGFPEFPILLETVRECLRDVYDLPALIDVLTRVSRRKIRLLDVETATPSPFANSLLFDYIGQFMYEGDNPLAERRAAMLSVDTALLAELLGRVDLRELLDQNVVEELQAELQRLPANRQARDLEGLADLLRLLGPLTLEECRARCREDPAGWLADLVRTGRAIEVVYAGETWWAAVEDAGRLRDGLGVPLPMGIASAFTEPVSDPLGDVLGRYARTHGPFTAEECAQRFGLGIAVVVPVLRRLTMEKRLLEGEFTAISEHTQWCDSQVLRRLRGRSLAAARQAVEPVTTAAFARFLADWQHLGSDKLSGVDGVATVVQQLAGVPIAASAWESLILPSRVADYTPAMLDELLSGGEIRWSGHGAINAKDGWIALHPIDTAPVTLPEPDDIDFTETHFRLLATLGATVPGAKPLAKASGGAYFFRQLSDATELLDDSAVAAALWELVWAGWVSGDTFAPVRARLAGSTRTPPAHRPVRRTPRGRTYFPRPRMPTRTGPPTVAGRWSLLPERMGDPTLRAHTEAEILLARHGVVTRGSVQAEGISGGFALMYRVLSEFEDRGHCRRGYFVDTLGGAQFATPEIVDHLRSFEPVPTTTSEPSAIALAACDPANPYGAALPWPKTHSDTGHRPARKAGALVVLVDGGLVLYLERGGKILLTCTDDQLARESAARCLAALVTTGRLASLTIERLDGTPTLGNPAADFLTRAGFHRTPRALRLRHHPL